ncbi:MAG: alanine racemase, partial [Bacteroidota bacterium]|nr:alanine racemase [Bacteroidota bacterium]
MASTSQIGIKKEALRNNIEFVKSILDKETQISVVIKGNAYGHGIEVTLPVLEELGINHFSVYSSPEAIQALNVKSKKTVLMIMGFICPKDYEIIIKNNIEFFVSDLSTLHFAIKTAKKTGKKAIIHIDIETGMNRTGLTIKDLKKSISILQKNEEYLIIKGLTSHFAGAESIANNYRIKKQFSVFKKRAKLLSKAGINPEIKHIASSAAAINYPETRLDMVRTGILIYGYWPTKETFINYIHRKKDKTDPLKRALFWQSEVIIIKTVPEGEFIGYGLSFQAQYKMK